MAQTILLVEDQSSLSEQIRASLVEHEYQVLIAENVEDGLRKISSEQPDLVMIGLPLSEMFAMLRRLRAIPQFLRLPVIAMLRERAADTDIFTGWDLGVDAYMSTPLSHPELISFVKRIFRSLEEDDIQVYQGSA